MMYYIQINPIYFMKDLLDPSGNYSKSEDNVKKFVESLSDEQLKNYYRNIELTPFSSIVTKEYKKRFFVGKKPKKRTTRQKIKEIIPKSRLERR